MASALSALRVFIEAQGTRLFPQSFAWGIQAKHDTVRIWLCALAVLAFACVLLFATRQSIFLVLEAVIGIHTFYTIAREPPPKPGPSAALEHRLMPGRQVVSGLALAAIHLGIEPMAPPSGFIIEPVAIGFINFMAQLVLGMRSFPVSTKLSFMLIPTAMHGFHPIHNIGLHEFLIIVFGNVTGMLCGHAINSDQQLLLAAVEVAHMNRRADSRLNHVIKGQCGGASALLSGLLRTLEAEGQVAEETREMMRQIQGMLDEAADWCHSREVFVQLEAGTYQSRPSRVRVREQLQSLVGSQGSVHSVALAMVDYNLLRLLAQEALSNAFKYAAPGSPILVTARMVAERPGTYMHVSIQNRNCAGAVPMSAEECVRAFLPGVKGVGVADEENLSRSDGVGLLSVKHAVALVGGAVWLSADDKHTTFHLKLPAQPCAHEDTDADACTKGGRPAAAAPEPSACVADLPSFVESSLPPSAAAPVPFCTPTAALSPATCLAPAAAVPRAAQVSTGGDSAAVASNPDTGSRPPPASGRPVCIGIDDSLMLRKTQSMLFRLFLQADPSRSGSIGGTAEEVSGFVDVVMGRKELSLKPATLSPADIAVLDQNIDLDDELVSVRGTDLAMQLRQEGFEGVICILTGAHRDEVERLGKVPAVDLAFEKNGDMQKIAKTLLDARSARMPVKVAG